MKDIIVGLIVSAIVLGSVLGYTEHDKRVKELKAERDLYEGMVTEAVKMITEEKPEIAVERDSGDIYLKSLGRVYQFKQICRPEMGM